MELVLVVAAAYLVGSVPFAFLLARRNGVDLRRVGSGNVGASNVLRASGVRHAIVAMLLDGVKGALAVLLAERASTGSIVPVAAGLASMFGHVYPVWLRFRGGKGVATAAGVFTILTPVALAVASVVFVATVAATRFISVGSVAAALTLPVMTLLTGSSAATSLGALAGALLIAHRHRGNLARVRAGTERRIGERLTEMVTK